MSFYGRRILNAEDIEVRHALSDPLGGIVTPEDVVIKLSNTDGYFNATDLRGQAIDLTRFDRTDSESALELSGIIAEQSISDEQAMIRVVSQDQDVLQTLIPRRTVTASLFSLAHADQGLGRTVPVLFGRVASPYPLPYVTDNTTSNAYDYLIGEGASYTNVSLYRDTIGDILSLVSSTEYTLNSSAYSGFLVARFPLRQAKFGGGLHALYATATGLTTEQNFAQAIRTTLVNSAWGLRQAVDEPSFSNVSSVLVTVGSLSCDGALIEPRPAIDVLNQLLSVRGMSLSKTTSSNWTLKIDQGSAQPVYVANFGHGPGQHWNNVSQFDGIQRTPIRETVSHLSLDYAKDYRARIYRSTVTRSGLSLGRERRIQNDFIQTGVTADKTVDYLAKRLIQSDQSISFVAGQEARDVQVGDLILYTAPRLGITQQVFRVTELTRRLDGTRVRGEGWASSIYSYTITGSIPPDVTVPVESLWSVTTPSAVTSLSIVGSGVLADGQGGFSAFQTLQYNVASESYAQTIVRYSTTGNSRWMTVAVDQGMGSNLSTRIDGLITGQAYDYRVSRINLLNPMLFQNVDLTNRTAPADASGPAAPTALAITDQHLKSISFEWTAPADKDVAYYQWEIRTAASGGGSLVDSGNTEGPGTKVSLTLNQIAYSTTRYLRVRAVDWSGNTGSYSSSLSFSFSKVVTGDVGSGQITGTEISTGGVQTGNVAGNAVTTAKRQLVNSQSSTLSCTTGALTTFTFTVGTGAVNMVTAFAQVSSVYANISVYIYDNVESQIQVRVFNNSGTTTNVQVDIFYW
jgi:hypothetical protein